MDLGAQTTLYMSDGSGHELCHFGDFADPAKFTFTVDASGSIGGLYISDGNPHAFNSDHICPFGNPLPAGTTISFSVSDGRLLSSAVWTVPDNATQPTGPYGVEYRAPDNPGTAVLTLTILVPGEGARSHTFPLIIE